MVDISSSVQVLSDKIKQTRHLIRSEEHTKMAYVVPFISILGYDVNSPFEVVPEYTCDFGVKKGEKVDYCIMQNSNPLILIECKDCRLNLKQENVSQLYRYFSVSSAKIAILTNGVDYMLFTDSEVPNIMDREPFYSFSLTDITSDDMQMIGKLHKSNIHNLDLIQMSNKQLFEADLDDWFEKQSRGISSDFLDYFRHHLNTYDLSDIDLTQILSEKLFSSGVVPSAVKQAKKQPIKSTKYTIEATGMTGIYSLATENICVDVAGSYLVYIQIYSKIYYYDAVYKVLYALIDYLMDKEHLSAGEIIEKNKDCDCPSFYTISSATTKSREYRGVSFRAALSFEAVLRICIDQCQRFGIDTSSFKLGLLSKDTHLALKDGNIKEPSQIRQMLEDGEL